MGDRTREPELVPALPLLGLYDSGRIGPARLGVAVAAAVFGARLLAMGIAGRPGAVGGDFSLLDLRELRIGLVSALCLGYALWAYGVEVQGMRARLAALGPLFPRSRGALEEARAAAGHVTRRARRRLHGLGLAISFSVPFAVDRSLGLYLEPAYWRVEIVLNWLLLPVIGIAISGLLGCLWADARRLSALAGRIDRVDLLDPSALSPFGRQALQMALLAVILPSLFAILVSDRGFAAVVGASAGVAGIIGGIAFLLPVQGIHRLLRGEKEAELARIHDALRGAPEALRSSGLGGWKGPLTPADLLAYEARIAAVREWPFGAVTVARLATLLLLPLGSWLGGALMERAVTQLLGP